MVATQTNSKKTDRPTIHGAMIQPDGYIKEVFVKETTDFLAILHYPNRILVQDTSLNWFLLYPPICYSPLEHPSLWKDLEMLPLLLMLVISFLDRV